MSKNSLKKLQSLILRLTPDEQSILESYLTGFQSQYGKYESKYLQLYKAISDIPGHLEEEEIRRKISPDASLDAFQKTCARLKDKIFDSLLLDFNILRPKGYSKPIQSLYKIRKQLSQAQVLYTRGLVDDARDLLDKGYEESCKYYYFHEAASFLQLMYLIETRTGNTKRIQFIEAEIEQVRNLRNITEKSEGYFNSIAFREQYHGNPETYIEELNYKINELESDSSLQSSILGYYYFLYLKVFYYKARKEYPLMEFCAREILHLLFQNQTLQTKPRIVNGYLLLTDANVYNRQFEKALEYINSTYKEILPGSKNHYEVLLHQSRISLYAGKLDVTEKMILEIGELLNTSKQKDTVFENKLQYYKANNLLLQGKYENAYKVVRQISSFSQDREGWNINVRILQIMIMIENGYQDEADQEIENFRKTLNNIIKTQPVSKRNILIFRVLTWLSKKDFDFGRVYKEHQKLVSLLASSDPDLRWDFFTPEIIPFHSWFMLKANKATINTTELYAPTPAEQKQETEEAEEALT